MSLLVRKPASEEERISGPPSLLDPSVEAELEARLALERLISLLVRKPASEEERSSGPASLLDPSAEAELEAKLARERRRLADIEKELKLEIQMKVKVVSILHSNLLSVKFKTLLSYHLQI
jgi:hypothetical protein